MALEEAKKSYRALMEKLDMSGIDAFGKKEDIISWLKAASIKIWSGNKLYSPEYMQFLKIFGGEKITEEDIRIAMECAEKEEIGRPEFFTRLVELDKKQDTNDSRAVARLTADFLIAMSTAANDFTQDEAIALVDIIMALLVYCDINKISWDIDYLLDSQILTSLYDQVTPLSTENYKKNKANNIESLSRMNTKTADKTQKAELPFDDKVKSKEKADLEKDMDGYSRQESLDDILAELNELTGLEKVKHDVMSMINFIRICNIRKERGMKVPAISYHLVFTGNPGTGKTTVARIIAKIYRELGIISKGQLVEIDRSGLVAGYVGQTALKTQDVIEEALGGVLFIDEAYSLANDKEDSYGKEAIETLLKAMEDNRDDLIVIVAGYDHLMHNFIDSNPGLRSRFNKYFNFPDYTGEELYNIYQSFCEKYGYALDKNAVLMLKERLEAMYINRQEHFGNARAVRNLFEHTIKHQADRLITDDDLTDSELMEIVEEDLAKALEEM